MIDVFGLFSDLCATVNTQQGGIIRPNTAFMQWVRDIELELFQQGIEQFEESQTITDELAPFLRSLPVAVVPVPGQNYGIAAFPKDYDYFCSARVVNREEVCLNTHEALADFFGAFDDANISTTQVTKVTNNRWNAIMQRTTLKPTADSPKCTQFDKGLKVAPKNIGIIQIDFLRKPLEAALVYTLTNAGTEEEYYEVDRGRTTSLEWNEKLKPLFIERLKKKYYQAITQKLQ